MPFLVFLGLTYLQPRLGEAGRYWVYAGKTVAGAWMLWWAAPKIAELKWRFSPEAIAAGVGVFVLWVGLDGWYPGLGELLGKLRPVLERVGLGSLAGEPGTGQPAWNPQEAFGPHSVGAWFFILVRVVGSTLVVPPLEEVFYRSFLYRYTARVDFQAVGLGEFRWGSFLVTSVLFGLTHQEWLAGILCGFVYQGLVCWRKRLGDALAAHAITNLLLAGWVVLGGHWKFW